LYLSSLGYLGDIQVLEGLAGVVREPLQIK
jgi:hypothetical protein